MSKDKFYKIINYIGQVIKGSKFEGHVFCVGGSVRDIVMGLDPKDIDLVIDRPDGGIEFANWIKELNLCDSVVIYPTYGTAMFKFKQFPDEEIECVMTRKEQYKDKNSRNPETCFGSLEQDIFRRDLTINSLVHNISTSEMIDITGKGIDDINEHVIRTTSENSDEIFIDDPLRILRVCRFSTRFGWKIEKKTYEAMVRNVDRLSIITKERIRDEFEKILMCKNATMGIKMLHDIGVMKYIVPEFDKCFNLGQNAFHFGDVAEHTLAVIDNYHNLFEPDVVCLLSSFLHDIGKINTRIVGQDGRVHFYEHENETELVETILKRLKYDNKTIKEVQFMTKNHMRTKNFGNNCEKIKPKYLNKLIYICQNVERFERLCRVIECDNLSHAKDSCIIGQYDYFMKQLDNPMFYYKLPINGNDVMQVLNIEGGPVVKRILDKLIKHAFNNPDIERETCLKMLPNLLKQVNNANKRKQ